MASDVVICRLTIRTEVWSSAAGLFTLKAKCVVIFTLTIHTRRKSVGICRLTIHTEVWSSA